MGQLISAGVLRGLLHRADEWGWRIPYALQWSVEPDQEIKELMYVTNLWHEGFGHCLSL